MTELHNNFSGKTVLVTGGSRGIGFGIAEGFAAAGANVTLLADDPQVKQSAARLSAQSGATVAGIECDITDSAGVQRALSQIDRIDVLINNAGLERITPLLDDDPAVENMFRRIVDINIMGTFLMTRHSVSKMDSGGRIILTGSIWSRTAVPEFSAYCCTKHANLGFMRSIAKELGPRGITVNAVCPGWVRTEASMLSLKNMSLQSGRSEEELLDEITGAQVIGGLLEPQDMASIYLYLASDAARNITGQAWNVDRGEVMA
ncbi:SDR family NAD(P)-dependent oxidoreductase [Roseovarius sp. EL26]|uniref:SDR family NAD(P)-dependent oxidoreductase n=1 Tax=Roseovarius sp. EL26 TaxID=2126672 RepID=UPI000EA056A3|nr:SDR family oxidoreductase [Roseovarius sp. EL26]